MFYIDKRTRKIVFFEHEVFELGISLYGLIIAQDINDLFKKWSIVLFIDIYDWYNGVNEHGINIEKDIFKNIIKLTK